MPPHSPLIAWAATDAEARAVPLKRWQVWVKRLTVAGFAVVTVLLAAASWSVANLLIKRIGNVDPLALVVWGSLAACPLLLVASLALEGPRRIARALATMGPFDWVGVVFQAGPTTLLAFGIWRALERKQENRPFIFTMGLFALSYAGLAISLWPKVVPPGITIWQAAAARESQVFMLWGAAFLVPIMLAYIAYNYWIFRGKVRPGEGYH